MIYKLQNAGKIAKTIIKVTKRAPVSSLDKIPIWKRIFPIMKTVQDDLTEMNKYHQLNVDEYNKTFGTNIQSIPFRTEFPINPVKIIPRNEFEASININNHNSPTKNVENIGGYYSKTDDQVVLPNTAKSSAAYHEFEHMGQYGLTNPEVTRWRIEQLVDPEKTANMTDNAKAYFLSEEEFPVHLRQYGENLGIGIGDPYPGDIEFDKLIEENGIGGASTFVKRTTSEEKRLMWRAMNGTLFASFPFVSTLFGIQKDKNGGIIKLQKAGSVPEHGNIEQIAKYNREHGTNFWKMSQVLEHDKHQAQRKTQDEKKSFWEILAGHPESAGEAILNKAIETANNVELPETRSKIYNDTGKAQLATTAGSLLTLPMLGEFSTYGLLGGSARLAGGFGGSAVGSWGLGKVGDWADNQFGTNWMGTTGRVIGGLGGWWGGSSATTPLFRNLAGKGITLHMPQETFANLRGQYFDNAARNIKSDTSVLWKLYNRDRQIKDYMEFETSPSLKENVVKLVHWDPMGTGVKKALPINGGFKQGPEYFAHFENGNLVPAKGQIKSKLGNGQLYVHEQHPLFFGGNKPWWETPGSELSDEYLRLTTFNKSKFNGPHQYYDRWAKREKQNLKNLRNWYTKYGQQNANDRFLIVEPNDLKGYDFNSRLGIMGSEVPMSKLEGFEYDPLLGTFKRARYTDPSIAVVSPQEAATTYHFDGSMPLSRPISEAELLGIPKGERSNPKALEDPYYWGYRQWNSRYNAAVESGNLKEAQRLRALHFITKVPNTKVIEATGMPKEVYHGSQQKFTVFDSSKTRPDYDYSTSTNMFSDNKNVALGYANNDPDKLYSVYLNLQNILERDFKGNPWNGSVNNSGKFQIIPEYGTTYSSEQEAEAALQKILDRYYPNDPVKQAEQRHYMYVTELMDPPHPERSTNAFSDEIAKSSVLDGGIVRNVKDYYDLPIFDENPELYKELTSPHIDYFVKDSRNIKSSAIITHDNFGRIIPIVKRDNFHNPDIRYKQGGILKAQK